VSRDRLFPVLTDIVQTAESSGFSSITVMDHFHQIRGVGPRENYMLEGNTILGGLAAVTQRVSLGLLVGGVVYRNPALLAKATTTLDIISAGRAFLGIGAAWNEEESQSYGFEFPPLKTRFEQLEEALQITRLMFTQSGSTFEGKHYRLADAQNNPQPVRGDIPIIVGGSGERKTLRLVAQYADACNVSGDVETVKRLMGVLDRHCEDVGRDPSEITRTRTGTFLVAKTKEEAQRKCDALVESGVILPTRLPTLLIGAPDDVAEQAAEFKAAGLNGLTGSIPDVWDLESVSLVGQAIGPVFA
jgi:F420-dependent oxidoreductase-like protein